MKPDRQKNSSSSRPNAAKNSGGAQLGGGAGAGNGPTFGEEPRALFTPAPIWLIFLFGIMFYGGQIYLDTQGGGFHPQVYAPYESYKDVLAANPSDPARERIAKGEVLYAACIGCHQANGLGTPGQFPPLAGSDWVATPNPARLIRIPLHGLKGPIKVSGVQWNPPAEMTPFGAIFSDDDVAAILSYVRQAWGNSAPPVTPEEVAAVRKETSNRSTPWTAEELLAVPIP